VKSATQPLLEIMHAKSQNNTLTRYESADCMTLYGTNFVSKARNVLLITADINNSTNNALDSSSWSSGDQIPFAWICGDDYSATRTPVTTTPSAHYQKPKPQSQNGLFLVIKWNIAWSKKWSRNAVFLSVSRS